MPAGINAKRLERLEALYGKAIARHVARGAVRDLTVYRNDPEGFIRDVLKDTRCWHASSEADPQVGGTLEMIRAVREHDRVAVRGANAVGKDHTAMELALWWAYAVGGLVLVTGPTQRQVDEICFGRELRSLWRRAKLPGTMLARALRLSDDDSDYDDAAGDLKAGILGFVSTDISRLTGHHAPRVMCIVTEAQGVADIVFDSLFNNATGEHDRILAVANPSEPGGRFYRASRPGSGWRVLRIPAHVHPNIVEGREVIPGGPSNTALQRVREEEGEASRFWRVYVEAEFPTSATDALITRAWLDASFTRWGGPRMEEGNSVEPVIGGDVARTGGDLCAAAPVRGCVCHPIETWAPDLANPTADAVRRFIEVMRRYGGRPAFEPGETFVPGGPRADRSRGRFVIDVALMGGGVVDNLRAAGWQVVEFHGARTPHEADEPGRYENLRAYGYWTLREAFQHDRPVLAPDERVAEELTVTRYETGTHEGIKIIRKPEIRSLLGRSPDRSDALMMAWLEANGAGGGGLTAGGECGI